jgi:hypothetical protein
VQRLPELRHTPVRGRHPLVYGAGLLLLVALIAFVSKAGMVWVLTAAGVAVLMGIGAIAIALRAP